MSSQNSKPRVVIIGAGFAGMEAANRLAKAKVDVTLVDRQNYHLFQPLLYQVATTGLNPSEVATIVRSNFRSQKNLSVLKAELSSVDREKRRVLVNDGELVLDYDYLLLCAGGRTSYFGNEDWREKAPGLKSLEDAVKIRNSVLDSFERAELSQVEAERKVLTTIVIIGGGPTGVELAGAFAELRSRVIHRDFRRFDPREARVILLEGGPTLLAGYHANLSEYTKRRLERSGVEVRLNERVLDVKDDGVITSEGELVAANVIWAAGVEGHPLAEALTESVDRRRLITVEADLRLPGDQRVYVCGDMASFLHDERFPRGLPGIAPVAIQQGRHAAANILRQLKGEPQQPFRYFDKGKMATIGRSAAVVESSGLRLKGLLAWWAWLFIHLLYLVEFKNRVFVFVRWIWAYVTWFWGVRIIFSAKPSQVPSLEQVQKTVESQESQESLENPQRSAADDSSSASEIQAST